MRLDPNDASAWVDLSALYGMKADWPEAERCAREALKREPRHPLGRVFLLAAQARRGDLQALEALRTIAADGEGEAGARARALLPNHGA